MTNRFCKIRSLVLNENFTRRTIATISQRSHSRRGSFVQLVAQSTAGCMGIMKN